MMQHFMPDIFTSDEAFLAYASRMLTGIGLFFLLPGLSCIFFSWAYCEWEFVPLFGGLPSMHTSFSGIALPMATLLLGLSLDMKGIFGWGSSLLLLLCLNALFITLAVVLYENLTFEQQKLVISGQEAVSMLRIGQFKISLIVNLAFALICTFGLIYLLLPSVRKIYWQP